MSFNYCKIDNLDVTTINDQPYPPSQTLPLPTIITQTPTWQAGSTTTFVSSQSPIAPWSSSASVDSTIVTGYYSQGEWFVFPNTPDPSFNIAYDFGSQPSGNYQLVVNYKSYMDGAIITISETNTSLSIGSVDTYVPDTSGNNVFGQVFLYFHWSTLGDMNINFSSATANPNSSGYNFALVGNLTLTKLN
jgi:hypothetical protein